MMTSSTSGLHQAVALSDVIYGESVAKVSSLFRAKKVDDDEDDAEYDD